jgi:hypothetical protein
VRPDMDADRFRRGWRRLPVLVRLWAWVLVPAFGIGLLLFGVPRVSGASPRVAGGLADP